MNSIHLHRLRSFPVVLGLVHILATPALRAEDRPLLELQARSRIETGAGSGQFAVVEERLRWDPERTAIVVCDMWNQHWCEGATRRVAEMAPRMNAVLNAARKQGVFIIHAPSGTMKHYEPTPQRKLAQAAPPVTPRVALKGWCSLDPSREPALPIDDSAGGCDDVPRCQPLPRDRPCCGTY